MSIKIMSLIWERGPQRQADRFVLLALADFANDDGECFPAVTTVARKTCMSVRGVQQIMRRLEADGWLKTRLNAGRGGSNIYAITPAPSAPPQDIHPRTNCTTPPHLNVIPPARGADEPSLTTNEPTPLSPQGGLVRSHRKSGIPSLTLEILRAKGLQQ